MKTRRPIIFCSLVPLPLTALARSGPAGGEPLALWDTMEAGTRTRGNKKPEKR